MGTSSTLDTMFGNLLLTNILLLERQVGPLEAKLITDHQATADAWSDVRNEFATPPRDSAGVTNEAWQNFLDHAVKKHLARRLNPHQLSCFLLYKEVDEWGQVAKLRTGVPASGVKSLLRYPYNDPDVIEGFRISDITVTPPLGAMDEPWATFGADEGSTLFHASQQGIVYHPDLLHYPRRFVAFDILAGLMSVVTIRIPLDPAADALGFLVLASVHSHAFGQPTRFGQQPTVSPEWDADLRALVEDCGVARNLQIRPESREQKAQEDLLQRANDQRWILSQASRRLRHDAAISSKELDDGARRLDNVRQSSSALTPAQKDLLDWASSCMRFNGLSILRQTELFAQVADSREAPVSADDFGELVGRLQTYVERRIGAACKFSREIDTACKEMPAMMQAHAVELMRNAYIHRDEEASEFMMAVALRAERDDEIALSITSGPHPPEKIHTLTTVWAASPESQPFKGLQMVRGEAQKRGWTLTMAQEEARVTIAIRAKEDGSGVITNA